MTPGARGSATHAPRRESLDAGLCEMGAVGRRCLSFVAAALMVAIVASPAAGQASACGIPGAVEVRSLSFRGNHAFRSDLLSSVVGTTPSAWVRRAIRVFGAASCLDRVQLRRDVLLLRVFYRKHGYYDTHVDTVVTPRGPRAVDVAFLVDEREPVRLDAVQITWRPPTRDSTRVLEGIDLRPGQPADRFALQAAVDTIVSRLRDDGYPRADIVVTDTVIDRVAHRARFALSVVTGVRAHIGTVRVRATPVDSATPQRIPDDAVRRVSGLRPGQLYSERDLRYAQRNLYSTEAYRHVGVRVVEDSASRDSIVDIELSVTEGHMYSARLGVGWATLDCFRATAELTNRNFLSEARRLDVTGRVSKIGVGYPLDRFSSVCTPDARMPFAGKQVVSDTLNYYGAVTFRQPALFGTRAQPAITVYSERRTEYQAYFRTTPIAGIVSLVREQQPRVPVTVSYQLEFGRTEASPALFCAVFRICDDSTRRRLSSKGYHRLAVAGLSLARDATNDPSSPSAGSILRFEFRHASPAIGSDSTGQFNKVLGDGSLYHSIGGGHVLALRLRVGAVFSAVQSGTGSNAYVPPQERLYAGGSTTVRGYRQNELGPVVYTVQSLRVDSFPVAGGGGYRVYLHSELEDADTVRAGAVPTGGNTLAVGNIELRLRDPILPDLLQWTIFADAGSVLNRNSDVLSLTQFNVKWTPGVALRVLSRLGPIGVYAAYNPYERPLGPAYYVGTNTAGGKLICASPGNTLAGHVTMTSNGLVYGQDGGECPSVYAIPVRKDFLHRLTFDFSIGQAF
ncbi:MAG: hypothetical protein NVS9B3_03110 [Gemmatimonadaceae bacterium]